MQLAKLEKINIREVWEHEASDFTNWLAEPENLELLGDEIGIDISAPQTEASVGSFKVDILAEEEESSRKIIIENQLERTNHNHLGQIITYASGVDAEIIIWIVKEVRDEHKQAVDWLNEHTDEKINIFAIQIEAWKIAGSPAAPKFHVIAQPNDWTKAVKKIQHSSELSGIQSLYLEFWTQFKEYAENQDDTINLRRKPLPTTSYKVRLDAPTGSIVLTVNSQTKQIGCAIHFWARKPLFKELENHKEQIENELSEQPDYELSQQLDWQPLPAKKTSKIKLSTDGDLDDREAWPQYYEWMLKQAIAFRNVFPKYIKQYSED